MINRTLHMVHRPSRIKMPKDYIQTVTNPSTFAVLQVRTSVEKVGPRSKQAPSVFPFISNHPPKS